MSGGTRAIAALVVPALLLALVFVLGAAVGEQALSADFAAKNSPPSPGHPFGTDWMGRDMLARTLKGLSLSIATGLIASGVSAVIGLLVGVAAGVFPGWVDSLCNWLIDFVLGIPHIVLLILISFAAGRGAAGVTIGIACTHWTGLARLIRGEALRIRQEPYIKISRRLGKSSGFVMRRHILPHMLPHFIVGLVLLFPHAILHEAAITFLGFGLSPEQPAVGIILSESMQYLAAGAWWLAVFPGAALVAAVLLFDALGERLKRLFAAGGWREHP